MKNKKYVYLFKDGNASMRSLLGGKGANLAEMTNIGLPVPPGFTITTEACNEYYDIGKKLPLGLEQQLELGIKNIEQQLNKEFGNTNKPLLFSVRSGASISMPGMMDTILNLGLNDKTVLGLIKASNNECFALDCYRRFIQMFGDVAMNIPHFLFEQILNSIKQKQGIEYDYQLTAESLKQIIEQYKELYLKHTNEEFPQDPYKQLLLAINAVFNSWNSDRAIYYRNYNKIAHDLGTAVNIQAMVFGNLGDDCGTGVAFTRNPSTGVNQIYGEYLFNAQGEDVVSGSRTPLPISELEKDMPAIYNQLLKICSILEKHYKNMQDIEFTIEKEKLYLLQTRNGKRTAAASIKIAVDLVKEGLITKEQALLMVDAKQISQLLHPNIENTNDLNTIAKGLPASPGAASGMVVFSADKAEKLGNEGENVILVRNETTPDDIHGLVMSQGVLTSRGGMTSHAAVVARGMGKPAVCGCEQIKINFKEKYFVTTNTRVHEGDIISIDGATGLVILGLVAMTLPKLADEFTEFLAWADEVKKLGIRANADNGEDALKAREFGATGIGLTRTEHMFMEKERLPIVQKMILADTLNERKEYLQQLLPYQKQDFYEILKAMQGYHVCIRLLDPPLHEFLPNKEDLKVEFTELKLNNADLNIIKSKEALLKKIESLHEFNPMLGHRGCRLAITYPEIYAMQAQAIFLAVAELVKQGYEVLPEVEIPLIVDVKELELLKKQTIEIAEQIMQEHNVKFNYTIGTMIELPRAALTADKIAKEADFFSFGTNDLTQTTFGFSRDDAESKFMQHYLDAKILKHNPFVTLDRSSVGRLMDIAITLGKQTNPNILIGICGEHGGDPESIALCNELGLDFVSCSTYRVPIARLAAAQAELKQRKELV